MKRIRIFNAVLGSLVAWIPTPLMATTGASQVTQIIDASGDGAGNGLDNATGVAVDGLGNAYVAGFVSDNVFKVTPDGVVTQIIDATGDGNGHVLDGPLAIVADRTGNVYVGGQLSHNVFKVASDGGVTEIVDFTGDRRGNRMTGPRDLALDEAGDLYIAAGGSDNAFRVTDPGGANAIELLIDTFGDGLGNRLFFTRSIAVHSSGKVYVSGQGSTNNIFEITPDGTITRLISTASSSSLAVDRAGDLYGTSSSEHLAFKLADPGGANAYTVILDEAGDGAGTIAWNVNWIALDGSDNAYAVSTGASVAAFQVTPTSVVTAIIDGSGDGAGNSLVSAGDLVMAGGSAFLAGSLGDNAFRIDLSSCPTFCPSEPNATGAAATIRCTGDPGASLMLTSTPVPDTSGQFFFGPMMLAGTPFGDGQLCVGGMVQRLLPILHAGMMMQLPNAVTLHVSYSAPYAAGLTGTRHFQYWFRSGLAAGAGFNTSNALSITF